MLRLNSNYKRSKNLYFLCTDEGLFIKEPENGSDNTKKTRNLIDSWLLTLTIKPKIYEKTLKKLL
jgi:hypothetical protein